jgi:hypothetical protein
MFLIMKNNVLDVNHSMFLGHLWLCNMKVRPDSKNHLITIKGNKIVWTIVITKHLDRNTKCLKVMLCYDFMERVTNEKKDFLLVVNLDFLLVHDKNNYPTKNEIHDNKTAIRNHICSSY